MLSCRVQALATIWLPGSACRAMESNQKTKSTAIVKGEVLFKSTAGISLAFLASGKHVSTPTIMHCAS